jgi:ATP-dependent DNA helicase RecG
MGNDGLQKYSTKYYNLDVILSVGYRVNSINAIRNEDMSQEMEENVPKNGDMSQETQKNVIRNGDMSQETQKNVIRNEISEEELIVDLTELSKNNLQKRHIRQQGIFNLIKQNPYITIDKMAEYLNVNARTIHRDMEELKNLIEHIGPTKGGYWKIKD